jgi:hypothetical protein
VRFIDENKEKEFQNKVEDEKGSWGKNRKIRIQRYLKLI